MVGTSGSSSAVESGNAVLQLLHFDVVSRSPVTEPAKISGAKLIAPSAKKAWGYLGDALGSIYGSKVPRNVLEVGYQLVPTGTSTFRGTESEWIQAQLKLRLDRVDKAVQLPVVDTLEEELERPAPMMPTKESETGLSKDRDEGDRPGLYSYPSSGFSLGPLFWGLLGLALALGAIPLFGILFPAPASSVEVAQSFGWVSTLKGWLTGPVGMVIGTLSVLIAGVVIMVRR